MIARRIFCQIENIYLRKFLKHGQVHIKHCSSKSVYLMDEINESTKPKVSKVNKYTFRSFTCGQLTLQNVGFPVILCGWLEFQRLNKFIILRDAYGQTQCLLKANDEVTRKKIEKVSLETIIQIKGTVLARPKDMINSKLSTGEIEVLIDDIKVLNHASDLPFNIRGFQKPKEAMRMQYRYLDLRFPEMQKNLRERSNLLFKVRQFLVNSDFVDVETPTLFKATPGGAQEFIVPTKFPGQFYSLVQSPQQFKQILMAGAIDRYFQIARCYRDETSRPDRQPEFTQLDIEMSFTTMDGIIELIENLLNYIWPDFVETIPPKFRRIKYADALEFYGSDKPDISFGFKLENCSNILSLTIISTNCDDFGAYCLQIPEEHSNLPKSIKKQFDTLSEKFPAVKFLQNKVTTKEDWIFRMKGLLTEKVAVNLAEELNLQDNSVLFLGYGNKNQVLGLMGRIRLLYADHLENCGTKIRKEGMHLAWITDFPLFEKDALGCLNSAHHPFTAPNPEDLHLLQDAPLKVRALAYDLVLNGNEIAGGSIRIHNPVLQEEMFKLLNINVESMKHIIEMLSSGCPPHGGIAIGLDRLLSILLKTNSIRDVIAFPKGAEGRDFLSGAPSSVSAKDLEIYHIKCA